MGDIAIENRINRIKELEAQKKELETQINELKNEIKKTMEQRGVDECRTKNFVVRWKEIVSNSFDSKTFKNENPEVYESYIVRGSSKRFTIS